MLDDGFDVKIEHWLRLGRIGEGNGAAFNFKALALEKQLAASEGDPAENYRIGSRAGDIEICAACDAHLTARQTQILRGIHGDAQVHVGGEL